MIKKFVSLILAVLLLNAGMGTVYAKPNTEKEARYAEKVKQAIAKLGTGETALVKIKLRDKTKLEGFVSAVGDDSFGVTDIKTGVATTVAYPQVKKVKGKQPFNRSENSHRCRHSSRGIGRNNCFRGIFRARRSAS